MVLFIFHLIILSLTHLANIDRFDLKQKNSQTQQEILLLQKKSAEAESHYKEKLNGTFFSIVGNPLVYSNLSVLARFVEERVAKIQDLEMKLKEGIILFYTYFVCFPLSLLILLIFLFLTYFRRRYYQLNGRSLEREPTSLIISQGIPSRR